MKILAISDTHGLHGRLNIPPNLDAIIVAGDMSNSQAIYVNYNEMLDFLAWLDSYEIRHKIIIAGNHDTSIERGGLELDKRPGIVYLENSEYDMEGIKVWGSPYTPSFGFGWAYNKDRGKIGKYWDMIPEDTNILVTHGPPKGILDISINRDDVVEFCGDKSLLNAVMRVKPTYHIFGHIHNVAGVINAGTKTITDIPTVFANVSCVTDNKFNMGPSSNGHLFYL
jgi:Icc-related predicted phosphoesterase